MKVTGYVLTAAYQVYRIAHRNTGHGYKAHDPHQWASLDYQQVQVALGLGVAETHKALNIAKDLMNLVVGWDAEECKVCGSLRFTTEVDGGLRPPEPTPEKGPLGELKRVRVETHNMLMNYQDGRIDRPRLLALLACHSAQIGGAVEELEGRPSGE